MSSGSALFAMLAVGWLAFAFLVVVVGCYVMLRRIFCGGHDES